MTVKTLVLSSEENFVWHSMQEIIPAIERTWMKSARPSSETSFGHEVVRFNIDGTPMSAYIPHALQADNIVLTCFNHKMARVGKVLRESLGLEARYFIYLHNQATIACWPFHAWGLANHLREDDVFLSSCKLDQEAFSLSFEKARSELIPFTEPPHFEDHKKTAAPSDPNEVPFVYVGRISEQKNLHTLIYAFSLFLKSHPSYRGQLRIYGGEDHLGSPNMGKVSASLAEILRDLCDTLDVKERVQFLGFRPREEIQRHLSQTEHIFVSPSLHSDENFGMAAFYSLTLGQQVVLSRWGGHVDFADHFEQQVKLVNVYGDQMGPWVDPYEFARAMSEAHKDIPLRIQALTPVRYKESSVAESLYKLAIEKTPSGPLLKPSELTKKVLEKREIYSSDNPCRIFDSYEDSLAQQFFNAYGMRSFDFKSSSPRSLKLPPWVHIEGNQVIIKDPHRGHKTVPISSKGALDEETTHLLLKNGWASFVRQEI